MLFNRASNKLSVCHLSTNNRAEKYSEKIYSSVVLKNLCLKLKGFLQKIYLPWKTEATYSKVFVFQWSEEVFLFSRCIA